MPKGIIIEKNVVDRRKGYMYFVDGAGNVREAKMNTKGGKPGRKVPRKNKCSKGKR